VWNPLHFAAVNGHFPTADDVPMVGVPPAVAADDYDAGYLWNAVPPAVSQYLDLEAACIDDSSSGSSYSSDGELDRIFIQRIIISKIPINADQSSPGVGQRCRACARGLYTRVRCVSVVLVRE
jgi:hypothetical protein